MELESLIFRFIATIKEKPLQVNELLDFAQRCYINNDDLTILQYRCLLQELTTRGGKKPEYFSDGYTVCKFNLQNAFPKQSKSS